MFTFGAIISPSRPDGELRRKNLQASVWLKAVKEAWYYSSYSAPNVAYEISNLISARAIREHGGRPGLEQFVQKKLRPVSGVMSLEK